MLIKTENRAEYIHELINLWLSFPVKSCASCGEYYVEDNPPCCPNPVIGTNMQIMKKFLEELRAIRETRSNKYASLPDKSMRFGISLPAGLHEFLSKTLETKYNEKLFSDEYPPTWFMKKFPQFTIPKEI